MITKNHRPSQNYNCLSAQQRRAIDLIIIGKTQEAIANEIGISRETISRWKTRDPRFIYVLKQQREILKQAASARLSSLFSDSLWVVEKALANSKAIENSEVQAAIAILQALDPYKILALEVGEEGTEIILEPLTLEQQNEKENASLTIKSTEGLAPSINLSKIDSSRVKNPSDQPIDPKTGLVNFSVVRCTPSSQS